MRSRSIIGAVVVAALTLAACGSSTDTSSSTTSSTTAGATGGSPSPTARRSGRITVFAAATLTKGFTALGREFEAANPGTTVTFSFGSSSELERRVEQGAPADVFASADQANMDKIVAARANAGAPVDFVKNKLEIAVEKGNPKRISTLRDLTKPRILSVLCDPSVPCGKFADQVLANAKVTVTPRSRESSVKATLSKVELGEADAAIVYVSDIASSGKVDGVPIPDAVNVITTLPVVTLAGSKNRAVASAFAAFVAARSGELVRRFGFLPL